MPAFVSTFFISVSCRDAKKGFSLSGAPVKEIGQYAAFGSSVT